MLSMSKQSAHQSWIPALLLIMGSLLCGACNARPATPAATEPPAHSVYRIGLAMDSLTVERWQRDLDIFVAEARSLGAEVLSQNANNDAEEQARQVEYLFAQSIDVLVIVPTDAEKAASLVSEAHQRGIPVVAYDRLIRKASVDLYVSFNNVRAGQLSAQALTDRHISGDVLLINGAPTDNNSYQFRSGYVSVLQPLADRGDIRILPEVWAQQWAVDAAYHAVDKLLEKGIVPVAIVAANDGLADGAIQALAERRLAGQVLVVGDDADLLACQRIVEGTQLATVYKPIKDLAKTAAQAAVELAHGRKPATTRNINDGENLIPWLVLEPVAVTIANMKTVFATDNYHKIEDIYRNVKQ